MFGSDICTCRPYLIFGIEEAVKEAQKGGSGVVIYFRKEGRALGEVTKVRQTSPWFVEREPRICKMKLWSYHVVLFPPSPYQTPLPTLPSLIIPTHLVLPILAKAPI